MDAGREEAATEVEVIRACLVRESAEQVRRVRAVRRLDAALRAQVAAEEPSPAAPARLDTDDVRALVEAEVAVACGVAVFTARHLVESAQRLHEELSPTLAAWEAGRLDQARVRVLLARTEDLPAAQAAQVQDAVLDQLPEEVWDGPSCQTWNARVRRAVARITGPGSAPSRETLAARTRTWVSVDQDQPALATFGVVAPTEDVLWLHEAVGALGALRADRDGAGNVLTMDQRRVGALLELVERAVVHSPAPPVPNEAGTTAVAPGATRRRAGHRVDRELGLVLHADTFFGDGRGADDPAELRGLGVPVPVGAADAREMARSTARNAPAVVLLAGADGMLRRCLRVGAAPTEGWTRATLEQAVRGALQRDPSPPGTTRYTPTTAIADHVRAQHPTCTAPTCHRSARGCDLDHDDPWPHGSTSVANLDPKSRRCHRFKTHAVWRTRTDPDGHAVTWTLRTGVTWTHRPEPLPGYGPGEAYGRAGGPMRERGSAGEALVDVRRPDDLQHAVEGLHHVERGGQRHHR